MFLLRRRSDNLFYINKHLPIYVRNKDTGNYIHVLRNEDDYWTDDPSKCKPFSNRAAAMQSRGITLNFSYGNCPIPFPRYDSPDPLERELTMRARRDWYNQRDRDHINALHESYETVEVEVRIKVNGENDNVN